MPTVIREWELAANTYFSVKSIAADKHLAMVMGHLHDHCIMDWLSVDTNYNAAKAMTFKEFMVDPATQSFFDFQQALHTRNTILINTPSHYSDERLRGHFEAAMLPELIADYEDDPLAKDVVDLGPWVEAVKHVDECCHCRHVAAKALFDAGSKKRASTHDNNDCPPKKPRIVLCLFLLLPLPVLTEAERALLNANHSCRKCCKPFITHIAKDLVCAFPVPDKYKLVTQAVIDTTLKTLLPDLLTRFGLSRPKATASIVDAHPIAAVFPNCNTAIEDEDDSSDDDANMGHRISPSHHMPHLFWDFQMEGPNTSLPVDVCGLIDNGAHLVLIDLALVDSLGLRHRRLHVTKTVEVALNNSPKWQHTELSEYINLKLFLKTLATNQMLYARSSHLDFAHP
ncbi:hypothetical protein B0H17DRAFT_1197849 [Mycena rosella]|uniref:Uncharacterized protein n=1 Tax=Mycena rosella TaxID=1033263 RepID=A0AAD7GLM3_MYCRO|nr:hypothetical protein B0H17DRAFT_1197849 [Mycena rosella]